MVTDWCIKVNTMLSTAAGEVVPNAQINVNVFMRIDVRAACHECPAEFWVRFLSPENVERRTTPESIDNHQDTQRF